MTQEQISSAQAMRDRGMFIEDVARILGFSPGQIKYNTKGRYIPRRPFSLEEKLQIAEMRDRGDKLETIAKRFGTSPSNIFQIHKSVKSDQSDFFDYDKVGLPFPI